MNAIRMSRAVALGVVLLGCEAQAPQSTPAQQQPEAGPPTQAISRKWSHDASRPSHAAAAAEHQHDDMHSMLRPLDQGQPWATDTALVEGLERIRVAVNEASAQPALDPDSAAALAQSVRDQVDFLIANCRLEPDGDATPHVFIARLLNAAAALQEDPASPVGLPQILDLPSIGVDHTITQHHSPAAGYASGSGGRHSSVGAGRAGVDRPGQPSWPWC